MNNMDFDEWLKSQPKKTEYLRFKVGVFLYQKRLWGMSHFMRDAENQYIEENMDKFLKNWLNTKRNPEPDDFEMSFSNYIGMQRGMFQAKHGIYRAMHIRGFRGFLYKLKMNISLRVGLLLRKYKI